MLVLLVYSCFPGSDSFKDHWLKYYKKVYWIFNIINILINLSLNHIKCIFYAYTIH